MGDKFYLAIFASFLLHAVVFSLSLPVQGNKQLLWGAWYTRKNLSPLIQAKLTYPQIHSKLPGRKNQILPDAAEPMPTVIAIPLPVLGLSSQDATGEEDAEIPFEAQSNKADSASIFAGGGRGWRGISGPAGDLKGKAFQEAQWQARKRSAYDYVAAFQQTLGFLPRPSNDISCVIWGKSHDCVEEAAIFGDLFVGRLELVYRLDPNFPPIQLRFSPDTGWSLGMQTQQ